MSDISRLVFTPLEVSTATESYIEELQKHDGDGMPLYIPSMEYKLKDKQGFLPVKRGELITVLGRPGSGKTGFMFRWARERAKHLKGQNKVVLYWTMEQMVEELRLFQVAAEENISASDMAGGKLPSWDGVKRSLVDLYSVPLWFAGKSMRRRKDRFKLNEESLRGALDSIETWQGDNVETEVDSVFVDYLQRFRPEKQDWVQFYGDLTNGLKEMAGDFATRFIVGVQAKREVDERKTPIPQMDDGQWTSSIEHQSDGMISVVRPAKYRREGEMFDDLLVSGHSQMIITVLKRKMGPDMFKGYVKFAPEYNRLDDGDIETFAPNEDR
jgi:replicative DNA helicase